MYLGALISIILVLLLSVTSAYLFALIIAVVGLICLSVYLSFKSNAAIVSQMILTHDGKINFNHGSMSYQLQPSCRCSFIGIWLEMLPTLSMLSDHKIDVGHSSKQYNNQHVALKTLFIYKDSLTPQDFCRVVNAVRKLQ